MPQIEVTFGIDANGIVAVAAKDKATGKEQQIRIQSSGGLSDSEIQKMVRDAEANAGADKKRRAFVEARNHADAMMAQIGKTLAEHGDLVPAAERVEAEAAIAATRAAKEGSDHDTLTRATERLIAAEIKIETAAHEAQAKAGGSPGDAGGKPGRSSEKVVDAEFEDVAGH